MHFCQFVLSALVLVIYGNYSFSFKIRIYIYFSIDIRVYTCYNSLIKKKGSEADEGIGACEGVKACWLLQGTGRLKP